MTMFQMTNRAGNHDLNSPPHIFYGWWIVVAAFLNLFLAVGIIFYGFPVFYPAFVASLGFTRTQVTQGFLLGFLVVGLPFGLLAGALIDRLGARWVILSGVGFIGLPLILMGSMTRFWQYEFLCVAEVLGLHVSGTDCQPGPYLPLVPSAARPGDGLRLFGAGTGRGG